MILLCISYIFSYGICVDIIIIVDFIYYGDLSKATRTSYAIRNNSRILNQIYDI